MQSLPLQAHAELDVASLKTAIETSVESDYPKLDALYKDIHAHPEIAFQEEKTAAKLAAEMRALGFEVTKEVGKTGLVAIYKNGDGPTIMVRTELDALPMEEKTGLPYASHDKTNLERTRDVRGPQLRPRHSHGELGRNGEDAGRPERPVAGHADVHRPAGRGNRRRAPRPCWRTACSRDFRSPISALPCTTAPVAYGTVFYRVGIGSSNSDSL